MMSKSTTSPARNWVALRTRPHHTSGMPHSTTCCIDVPVLQSRQASQRSTCISPDLPTARERGS